MQKQKQARECPKCGGPVKRTIGAQSRKKFWECVDRGVGCYRAEIESPSMEISDRWYPR